MTERMTKGEREDLVRLIKQREKVAKTVAEQRTAAMLAEFERQVSAVHAFDNNEVWSAAMAAATDACKKANEEIAAEAARLGIPEEFRPQVAFTWVRRGENEFAERRTELRRLAKAEAEAMEKHARAQIESQSVSAQTEVIAHGLSSEAAIAFLNSMPAIEAMMPAIDMEAIQQKLADRNRGRGRSSYLVGDD